MSFATLSTNVAALMSWAPQWLVGVALSAIVLIGGILFQALLLWLTGHVSKRWHPVAQFIFLKTRRIARYAIVMLAVGLALPLVPLPGAAAAAIMNALRAAAILLFGWIAYSGIDVVIERYVNQLHFDAADNLSARKAATQMRVLRRAVNVLIVLITLGFALMSFDTVRQYGVSLFASAGVAGLVAGLAARPVLSNLIAGMQLALTQPIRLDDVVVVEGEWGRVEEFTATYVVIRIWDLRRLIVPLSYFLEKPFTNWTHTSADILGTVYLYTDYTVPVERVREKAVALIQANPDWDGKVAGLVVTAADAHTMELRALMSASDSSKIWTMRCAVREALIAFLQAEYPGALPRTRAELSGPAAPGA